MLGSSPVPYHSPMHAVDLPHQCHPYSLRGTRFICNMLISSVVACHHPAQEDETFAQANQTASEAFTNIRTIAAFGMEGQVGRLAGLWAVSLAAV